MKKTTIVINGPGGVGKDALIQSVSHYRIMNVSSIDPIKQIAAICGWDGQKDDDARKFLSDLKALTVNYNEFPTRWVHEKYLEFIADDKHDILFVHIREPEEICKFVSLTKCKTLLISSGSRAVHEGSYGNKSDDLVGLYDYDYVFENDKDFEESKKKFSCLIGKIVEE